MRLMQHIPILASLMVPVALIGSISVPVQASSRSSTLFYCGKNRDGFFTTYARPARGGRVPVITWKTTVGDRYDPETRCRIVSERFQTFHNSGTLRFLTTGKINNQNVVCVASAPGRGCMADGLLFTVTQTANASSVLKQLSTINTAAGGSTSISETTCPFTQEVGEQFYFNVDCYLNDPASVEKTLNPLP